MSHRLWLSLLLSAWLLAGCGYKGALYLPDQPAAQTVAQTGVAPA
ncbi:MAG: lipoprotein [Magnetococcales bacterium]|nr:lipoprotein [Magnetococcales bacterium]